MTSLKQVHQLTCICDTFLICHIEIVFVSKYQLSSDGALVHHLQPAIPHRLQNEKWAPGGPKVADGVWEGDHWENCTP